MLGCRSSKEDTMPNQTLAEQIDLERFMGQWHVHGSTPTFMDKKAVNATETYALRKDGKIETTYSFRKKSPDGNRKTMRPLGWVYDETTNSEWRMRFFGVFTTPYYILYVSEDYETTVVGHPGRKLAWIMSRSSEMDEQTYDALVGELKIRDYDLSGFKRMLQQW